MLKPYETIRQSVLDIREIVMPALVVTRQLRLPAPYRRNSRDKVTRSHQTSVGCNIWSKAHTLVDP